MTLLLGHFLVRLLALRASGLGPCTIYRWIIEPFGLFLKSRGRVTLWWLEMVILERVSSESFVFEPLMVEPRRLQLRLLTLELFKLSALEMFL